MKWNLHRFTFLIKPKYFFICIRYFYVVIVMILTHILI